MIEDYNVYKDMVNDHLTDFIPKIDRKSSVLYDSMKYSLTAGGKRLRPVLLLASCEFAGGRAHDVLPYACAAEYIHTYSLIHDDLPAMDDDDLRRGQPTNHKVYGAGIATLAGDGLLNTAFEIMMRDMFMYFDDEEQLMRRVKASYALALAAGVRGMIAGQTSDLEQEGQIISEEMLDYIHMNKTGMMIRGCVRAGLYLGGADDEMLANMTEYAENLGLAFQAADDILDVTGDADEMGKATGEDQKNNKVTHITLDGMESARERLSRLTQAAVDAIAVYYDNAEFFRDLALNLEKRTY
ncbi:MAG: polyprenyl synthetase family protein [Anaerovoracaceae bacterium]|jgi:geranylgeranyl diphosphate synthase type II